MRSYWLGDDLVVGGDVSCCGSLVVFEIVVHGCPCEIRGIYVNFFIVDEGALVKTSPL